MKRTLTVLTVILVSFATSRGPAQIVLDPQIKDLLKPRVQKFNLYSNSIKKKFENKFRNYQTYQYYNPNGTLGKKDVQVDGRQYNTKIFFYRQGKIFRVREYDYSQKNLRNLDEYYRYDDKGRIIRIERFNVKGLLIKKRPHPLLIMEAKLSYDDKDRVKSISMRKLKKNTISLDEKITPAEVNRLFTPREDFKEHLVCRRINFDYDSASTPSKIIEAKGLCGQLFVIKITEIDQDREGLEKSITIPGIRYEKKIRQKLKNNMLVAEKISYILDDDSFKESSMTFAEDTGLLLSWEGDEKSAKGKIHFKWQFESKEIEVKEPFQGSESKKMRVPERAYRLVQGKKDQLLEFTYGKYGHLESRTLYQLDPKSAGKKRLISEEKYKYTPNYYYYRYKNR